MQMEIQGMERMNQQLMDHVGKVIVGKEHTIEPGDDSNHSVRTCAAGGCTGYRENDARQIGSLFIGLHISTDTVYTGLAAL